MNHYVYKITDITNKDYYIGVRSCECDIVEDNYMGSYSVWNPDIDNLSKSVLGVFPNRKMANEFEVFLLKECINDDRNKNYHIPPVGFHLHGKKYTEKEKQLIYMGKNNPNWKGGKRICDCGNKKDYNAKTCVECRDVSGKNNPFYGRKHSKETREKMSELKKGVYRGKNHPQAKKVKHIESGKIFDTAIEAGKYFNLDNSTVGQHCNGRTKKQKFCFIQ